MTKPCSRTCVVCRSKKDKSELVRFVLFGDEVVVDKSFKAQCRGAYVCLNSECLNRLIKSKALVRALGHNVSETVLESVIKENER